ncbi:MAG: low molecular weight phosphotyrosine protein phosphatase [Gammaproteobacteria bacterium]|nr:low molecular weight phosphotyrosine protein phosphatase [Gammaproteobacteria bacterium]
MRDSVHTTGVLFVCMGNICRSPTAEGVFRKLLAERAPMLSLHVDSAGTHDYHLGQAPDARAIAAARVRGIDIQRHRGRQVSAADFEAFDYILAMDRANLAELRAIQPRAARAELNLLLAYAADSPVDEVPDPYFGGTDGFVRVLDLVELGAAGLLTHVRRRSGIEVESSDRL